MTPGPYYKSNNEKLKSVDDRQWAVVLQKCKRHVKLRIKQRTLFGAHSEKNLGEDPIHYYTAYAYEAIISGEWEWQGRFDLAQQMITIINSRISTQVEKIKTAKAKEFKITYKDIEAELYNIGVESQSVSEEKRKKFVTQVELVESAISGDTDLEFFWEGVKEGKKRAEIAELMDKTPRQLDKIKEKFIRTIRKNDDQKNNNL